jgi:N-acetylmuramoyl-L-alanine amidase
VPLAPALLAALALGLSALAPWLPASARADEAAPPDRFDTVVIDPGHGGDDEGAIGPGGEREKDVVLRVAQQLAGVLRARELRVVMTRDSDRYVSLEQRTHVANDARGDLFLSIHANAHRDHAVRGTETFFHSLQASDADARSLAERENLALGVESARPEAGDDPLRAIFGDMLATQWHHESQAFAGMAEGRLAKLAAGPSRGVKQAPFVVLQLVQMTASLVEIGFISNAQEERALASRAGGRQVAEALAAAVLEYGQRYDAVRGVVPAASGGTR